LKNLPFSPGLRLWNFNDDIGDDCESPTPVSRTTTLFGSVTGSVGAAAGMASLPSPTV
jgi:hypothetical protein